MAKSANTAALANLRNFLDVLGWGYLRVGTDMLRGLFGDTSGQWHWVAHCSSDSRFLVFCSFCPINVARKRRAATAEYLMRANWGLSFGNFEIDWSDGQVQFRTTIPIETPGRLPEAMEHLVYGNCALMNQYLPGLLAVACGKTSPKTAVRRAEGKIAGQRGAANAAAQAQVASSPSPQGTADLPEENGLNSGPRFRRFLPGDN